MLKFVRRWQNVLMAILLVAITLIVLRMWPHQPLRSLQPSSIAVYDDRGRLLRLALANDQRYRLWTPLRKMPPALVQGVLLQEDTWFRFHPGFNPLSLARGAWVTYGRGGSRQGGSTITMQLARLIYHLNTRSPGGKIRQVLLSIQLELFYSKDALLEAYLNYAPYGRNIEGVGAASLIYFDKPISQLTLPESLTLAVIPQDPSHRGGNYVASIAGSRVGQTLASAPAAIDDGNVARDADSRSRATLPNAANGELDSGDQAGVELARQVASPSPAFAGDQLARLKAARARLFARWQLVHPQDAALQPLMALPLRLRATDKLPFAAPHFVEEVLLNARQNAPANSPLANSIATTLDLDLQHVLEAQLKHHVEHAADRGIKNAVALLVDTRDMGIKALVGSADYFDRGIAGQVNGTQAKRSPGSALKPFIYALGFDQGVLHPQTVLRDVPTSFGPFAPENFDGRFLGPVTATEALVRSRNIPAVTVASKLKDPSFYEFLKDAGISRMANADYYGLALVLGGGEVTMQELAKLYAMLANRGVLHALRQRSDDAQDDGARMLSDESSFMVLDMLRQNPRPDDSSIAQPGGLPVYWKTGTSWGFRDAWTAGIVGPYVLVVWIGNFDGSGNPAFVGVEAAAPLFFHIVDALRARDPQMREPARAMPKNLKRVEVCLASGDLPNAWCPQRGMTWFIPGKSPIRVSTIHRPVVVDNVSGAAVCPPYDSHKTHTEVYEFWPSDLARVFRQAGIPRRSPPSIPDCAAGADQGQAPQITSPVRGVTYTRRASRAGEERIAFSATVDASAHVVFWFVDDNFVGTTLAGEQFFWRPAAAGEYALRVVDDHGRVDMRSLRVDVVQ